MAATRRARSSEGIAWPWGDGPRGRPEIAVVCRKTSFSLREGTFLRVTTRPFIDVDITAITRRHELDF